MDFLNKPEKEYLLDLVFQAIKDGFKNLSNPPDSCPFESLEEERASFVTLKKSEQLRGCIGHIKAVQPLFQDVYENAQSAAFSDPRFLPLTKDEINNLAIEISVLSVPEKMMAKTVKEKLENLTGKEGVVLEASGRRSTFLPQVWQQVKNKQEFLEHLSRKAGLPRNAWQDPATILYTYHVDKFSKSFNKEGVYPSEVLAKGGEEK